MGPAKWRPGNAITKAAPAVTWYLPLEMKHPKSPGRANKGKHYDSLGLTAGRTYLVDCGSDFPVFPASATYKKSRSLSDPLMAANDSLIKTWGKRKLSLILAWGRSFNQELHVADVIEYIPRADFFIKHDLAIDMARHRLVDMKDPTAI